MVNLKNGMDVSGLNTCIKFPYSTIGVDVGELESKLQTLEKVRKKSRNKFTTKSLESIEGYIKKAIKNTNNGELNLCWECRDEKLLSYPTMIVDIPEIGLRMTDCLQVDGNSILEVRIRDLKELISFEYANRDLGYEYGDIERMLEYTGIIGKYESRPFVEEMINRENLYNTARSMFIENSPYVCVEDKTVKSYLGKKEYKIGTGKKYDEVIVDTCKTITGLIATDLVTRCLSKSVKCDLISVASGSFIVSVIDKDKFSSLVDNNTIRIMNRTFELKSEVVDLQDRR